MAVPCVGARGGGYGKVSGDVTDHRAIPSFVVFLCAHGSDVLDKMGLYSLPLERGLASNE